MDVSTYKFIDEKMPYVITASMERPFSELQKCLKSENVFLSMDDILKSYDVFLRIIGLGKGYNSSNPDEFCSIFSNCGVVKCADISAKISEGVIDPVVYESIFDNIDAVLDDENKFENLIHIKENIITIFKEFTIFTNDLFEYIDKSYSDDDFILEALYSMNIHKRNKTLSFMFRFDSDIEIRSITIMSDILSDSAPDKISVIVDSFPESVRKIFINKEKEMENNNE